MLFFMLSVVAALGLPGLPDLFELSRSKMSSHTRSVLSNAVMMVVIFYFLLQMIIIIDVIVSADGGLVLEQNDPPATTSNTTYPNEIMRGASGYCMM